MNFMACWVGGKSAEESNYGNSLSVTETRGW